MTHTQLKIGNKSLEVEIADEPGEIEQGLSGRNSLGENTGMYFILPRRQISSFWMNEMNFPLDIIWIDQGRVVGIEKNAPTPQGDTIPSFTSSQEVTHVLEVNAGWSDKVNLQVGDSVSLL
jgi:uncharacterized membrane protein (UPF0127 family)